MSKKITLIKGDEELTISISLGYPEDLVDSIINNAGYSFFTRGLSQVQDKEWAEFTLEDKLDTFLSGISETIKLMAKQTEIDKHIEAESLAMEIKRKDIQENAEQKYSDI